MAVVNVVKLSELEETKRVDAEYYKPEYFSLLDKLKKSRTIPVRKVVQPARRKFKPKRGKFFEYIEIAKVNLSTGEFETSEIAGEEAPDRAQWVVRKDDILVSTVRPIRNAITIIREDKEDLVCSSGFAVIHPVNVLPNYLFLYFKTKFIPKLLDRYTTATEYPAITWKEVLNIPIYLGDEKFQKEISKNVENAFRLLEQSRSLYSQAGNLLLEELRLKDFKPEYELSYTANLSQAFSVHRMDAEYFQPVYHRLIKYLKDNFEVKPLKAFILDFQKGIEVGSENYQEEGKLFIRVSNLSIHGFVERDQKYIDEELYQTLKDIYEPKVGDFLLTKDATPGIAYVVKEPVEGIIASGILKLRVNEEEIDKEYLALCINSMVGRLQIERDGGGSVITHWKPEQIKNLQIPILPLEVQRKIAKLVKQSHEARRKAKELLEEGKRKIEKAIEDELEKKKELSKTNH